MEQQDLDLINRYMGKDDVLAGLYKEHVDFEHQLEKFNHKPFLTPSDEMEKKVLQKRKLRGRDMIEEILRRYRKVDLGW